MGRIKMRKKSAKLWAHYEEVRFIIALYIILIFAVLFFLLCFSLLAYSEDIDAGMQNAVKIAILNGMKWYAIIMPIISVLFIIWFFYYSDRVLVADSSIEYDRWLFAKGSRHIASDDVTECILCARSWNDKREHRCGRKIVLFHGANTIVIFDISIPLAVVLVKLLGENKFKIVSDKGGATRISHYYKVDFMNLSSEQQLAILKHYCSFTYKHYKTGEEILKKKKLL